MRQLLTISLFTFLFSYSNLCAQNCSSSAVMTEGTVLEYSIYDKKNKLEITSLQKIVSVENEGTGLKATREVGIYDVKGGNILNSNASFICKDGVYSQDITGIFNDNLPGADELVFEGDKVAYPENMKVGDQLADATVSSKIEVEGATEISMSKASVFNRKVESKETLTTAAGTFECYVIAFDWTSKVAFVKVTGSSKEWYSPDVGVVKTEKFNKRGKYTGKTVLTKLEK